MSDKLYMVIDVESIGLHGEGFAVGYVVVNERGERLEDGYSACPPNSAIGGGEGRAWVAANVPPLESFVGIPKDVRDRFWGTWQYWREKGAVLVADCAWPVEARFLIACVDDDPDSRTWGGPYPLHELASFMAAAGLDPMATYDRLPDEPQHHPLGDARQSARMLIKALGRLHRNPFSSKRPS